MRSFQRSLSEFTWRGVKIVAISVDSIEINRSHSQKMGYAFPLLSDADSGVIRRYDVLHRAAGPKNTDIARPAEFYVDASGTVQWVNLTENIAVRARPEQALSAIDSTKIGRRD